VVNRRSSCCAAASAGSMVGDGNSSFAGDGRSPLAAQNRSQGIGAALRRCDLSEEARQGAGFVGCSMNQARPHVARDEKDYHSAVQGRQVANPQVGTV
jgi:hypothetical protein